MTQGVISRAEDQDYGNLAVNTILKIADGFDVAFVGEFVPYSELEHFAKKLSNKKFVASFEEEDQLKTKQRITGDNVLTKSVAINTYSGLQQEYGKRRRRR